MASCDSFRQIFETPLPGNPTLIESLSTHIKPKQPVEPSSFTEIFGELHFKETLESSSLPFLSSFPSPSSSSAVDIFSKPETEKSSEHTINKSQSSQSLFSAQKNQERSCSRNKDVFSAMNSESLHMCTEGLGFESFGDLGESDNETVDDLKEQKEKVGYMKHSSSETSFGEYRRRLRRFPPPIPSIGRNGKLWVSYKSFRLDGRLVLKEVMIPTQGQEFMHACREDGRLTLHLVHRDREIQLGKEKVEDEGREEDCPHADADADAGEENYGGKHDNHAIQENTDKQDLSE